MTAFSTIWRGVRPENGREVAENGRAGGFGDRGYAGEGEFSVGEMMERLRHSRLPSLSHKAQASWTPRDHFSVEVGAEYFGRPDGFWCRGRGAPDIILEGIWVCLSI